MADEAIGVMNASYSYGDVEAVRGITFNVDEGEIFGFLGPNGAGKSTTIKMLTGQLRPREGEIKVLGLDIMGQRGKVQSQIGICFERTNLYEQMSAYENLKLFSDLYGVRDFDADELLLRVDLKDRGKDKVSTYSKGMKQRLMVARSLVNESRILFLDEPTEGLDPKSADRIRNVILEERDNGVTVFLTTHDMMEADKLSDRVAFINNGEIAAIDTPHNLKQKYGKRIMKVQIMKDGGDLEVREIIMDGSNAADDIYALFKDERIVTIHSEEASLEDIFIQVTGRGLSG